MSKKLLSEDTVIRSIVGNPNGVPVGEYRKFLYEAIGKHFVDSMGHTGFQNWLFSQTGKTLKEVVDEHTYNYKANTMEVLLSERRFDIVSEHSKSFILAFDKAMNERGYDCENMVSSGLVWGMYMIIYGKTDTKSRPCAARIYIQADGTVSLRFFLTKVDKHMQYIEAAPEHIKQGFNFTGGDCTLCNMNCTQGKVYTIDGHAMAKCSHNTFFFNAPSVEKLPDYMRLFAEFYPTKNAKAVK